MTPAHAITAIPWELFAIVIELFAIAIALLINAFRK
jgi:hypothetical protein